MRIVFHLLEKKTIGKAMQETYLTDKKITQASLQVALSGVLYGFLGFLGTNLLRDHFSISTMLFWRFFIAGFWIFLFVIKKHSQQKIFYSFDKRLLLFMFFLGAIGYASSSEFYFIASQYTGTGLAMVIFFSYPIIVAFVTWIQMRHFNLNTFIVLMIMMGGLYLLHGSSKSQFNILGIVYSIIAASSYAAYLIGSKWTVSARIDSHVLTSLVCFGCSVIFLILSLLTMSFVFPHNVKDWIYFFALGIFATALPIQLMLEGLKYISSIRASIISVLEPLVTVFVGILLLNESLTHIQIIGIFIILAASILVQFQKKI